jgi:hypothetical protein
MTPKEKAKELVYKMSLATDEYGYINTNVHRHKQCALIAVDEIVKYFESYVILDYWNEVKNEIEKL